MKNLLPFFLVFLFAIPFSNASTLEELKRELRDHEDVSLGRGMSTHSYSDDRAPHLEGQPTGHAYESLGVNTPTTGSDEDEEFTHATEDVSCCSKRACQTVLSCLVGLVLLSAAGYAIFG